MKKIISILAFFPVLLFGQNIPDTIFVEAISDTTFLIAIGKKNSNNDKLNITYIDNVYDSVQVAEFAFNRISRNEDQQWEADKIKLQADALTALYGDVNGILNAFTGAGYIANAFNKYRLSFIGYYQARLGNSSSYFVLNQDGTAEEVNSQLQPIQGFSGTWDVVTSNRWRLKNFFPGNVLTDGSVLSRLDNPTNTFMAVGSNVVITKIKAIGTLD